MTRTRSIDAVLGLYPPWWRARYGDEVRVISADAVAGGQRLGPVIVGLFVAMVRTRVSGKGTPNARPLWANRTRACIVASTIPALVVIPFFFLTFKEELQNHLPLGTAGVLVGPGRAASDAFSIMALAGLLALGLIVRGYRALLITGAPSPHHRTRGRALTVLALTFAVVVVVTYGVAAVFALVALACIAWGQRAAAHTLAFHPDVTSRQRRLTRLPEILAGVAVVGWVCSQLIGPRRFIDRGGLDIARSGHPGLAHVLLTAAGVALGMAWLATFAMLMVVGKAVPLSTTRLRLGRDAVIAVAVLQSIMGGGAIVTIFALARQSSLHPQNDRAVVTTWGHAAVAVAIGLLVAATVSALAATASARSLRMTSQLDT